MASLRVWSKSNRFCVNLKFYSMCLTSNKKIRNFIHPCLRNSIYIYRKCYDCNYKEYIKFINIDEDDYNDTHARIEYKFDYNKS